MTQITQLQTLESVLFGEKNEQLALSGSLEFIEEVYREFVPINAEYNPSNPLLTLGGKVGHFIERLTRKDKIHIPRRSFTAQNDELEVEYYYADLPIREGFTIYEPQHWSEKTANNPALHFLNIIFKNRFKHKNSYERDEWFRERDYSVIKHYNPQLPDYQSSDPRLSFTFKEIIWYKHIDPRPLDQRFIKTDDTIGIQDYFDYRRFLQSYPQTHKLFSDTDSYYNANQIVRSLQRLAFEQVVSQATGDSHCIASLTDFYQGFLVSGPQVQKRINDSCLDTGYWMNLNYTEAKDLREDN